MSAGVVEVRVVAEAGEDIQYLPTFGGGLADTARGQQRDAMRRRQILKGLIPAGFATEALSLDLDVDVSFAKGLEESAKGRIGISATADGS